MLSKVNKSINRDVNILLRVSGIKQRLEKYKWLKVIEPEELLRMWE